MGVVSGCSWRCIYLLLFIGVMAAGCWSELGVGSGRLVNACEKLFLLQYLISG